MGCTKQGPTGPGETVEACVRPFLLMIGTFEEAFPSSHNGSHYLMRGAFGRKLERLWSIITSSHVSIVEGRRNHG